MFYFDKYGGAANARQEAEKYCYLRTKEAGMLRNQWRRVENPSTGDVFIEVELTQKKVMQVDVQDLTLVEAHMLCYSTGYASAWIRGKKNVFFHRLILPDAPIVIDHIDGNPLNNRRQNLRAVTQQMNTHNRKVQSRNKSGFNGVYRDKRRNCYVAHWVDNDARTRMKRFSIGCYGKDEAWRMAVERRRAVDKERGFIIRGDHTGKRPRDSSDDGNDDDDLSAPPPAKRQRTGQIDDYFTKPSSTDTTAANPLPQ
jgi:hypothetical protein